MSRNANLKEAKRAKNDEFYTQLSDIERELSNYQAHFYGKTIYLNCDNPEESNFWQYFSLNFKHLGLKKLIATHFNPVNETYKLEMYGDNIIRTPLEQNGDFRSSESIEILQESDIVVTNPPFSLFREYIAQLMEYEKKFLVIGNPNAITHKEIFPYIKDNELWLGINFPKEFLQPDDTYKSIFTCWYTNLNHSKQHEELILYKHYSEEEYPKYDNYDAINIDKVKHIPCDYDGIMGVPITFFDKYNRSQFEIIGTIGAAGIYDVGKALVGGIAKYKRLLIRKLPSNVQE